MSKKAPAILALVVSLVFTVLPLCAQVLDPQEQAELVKALRAAKVNVSLERALAIAERTGKPISAGFEVVEGELTLWVFVVSGEQLLEISIDEETGEVDEIEAITDPEDVRDAKQQSGVMAQAQRYLRAVTAEAVKENEGFRAVNVTPVLSAGHPVAYVTLLKDQEFKVVTKNLDVALPSESTDRKLPEVEVAEWDPWEPFNETVFSFNRQVDRFIMKPIARVYNALLPQPVKQGVANVLTNLDVTRRLVNNLLQLKIEGAGRELTRFTINSTVGVAGIFDVAGDWLDIKPSDRDTGQTLGRYGLGPGPYLVLPLLPPLTVRDFFGFIADEAMYPVDYFIPLGAAIGINGTEKISDRAENLDKTEGLEETVIDHYGSVRNAYFQWRAARIQE